MNSSNVTGAKFGQLFRLCDILDSMYQTAVGGEVTVRPGMERNAQDAFNSIVNFIELLTDEKVMEIQALMSMGYNSDESYEVNLNDARANFSEFSRSQVSGKGSNLKGYIETGLRKRNEQRGQ
ncbi:hypothetical protein ACO0K9_13110 [Undibacterium sp. Ji50W]|uniref:hypothetical protein n=1 Tax=Undibacterium sp. Ji50W TaxID=3413041 RepID=UPI003BF14677